ncbi:amino acid permease-domain-containing protein [Aspergillus varians]
MESPIDLPALPARRASMHPSITIPALSENHKGLRTLDVACLIINKVIGGGIFVSPGIVAQLTGNKLIALALWVFGGLYSFCSTYIYLEYGLSWPYNGGEFLYISKVFPIPPLFFASAFSWFFIAFATPTTNSITFARYINPNNAEDPDVWFTKFFACVIVVGICAMHYCFVTVGIAANKFLAGYKVLFLGVMVIAGLIETCRQGALGRLQGVGDYTMTHGSPSATNIALAILQVLYTYQGWENANYVISGIKGVGEHRNRRLKWGALIAVTVVVMLYISFNMFFFILEFQTITHQKHNVAADYVIKVFRSSNDTMASNAIYVCIALAAAGNIVGVTFSNARVIREIAKDRLIPFYGFFSKSSIYGRDKWDDLGTPTGGLILQALATCITIASIQPFHSVLNLYTYGHAVVCFILGIGVLYIRKRIIQYDTKSADPMRHGFDLPAEYQVLKKHRYRYIAVAFFTLVHLFLVIVPFIPSRNPDGSHRDMQSWVHPVVVSAFYVFGALVALYVLGFVEGLTFRGSEYNFAQNSDGRLFREYNERRWIVQFSDRPRDWKTLFDLFKPLQWRIVKVRLQQNGEAEAADKLRTSAEAYSN